MRNCNSFGSWKVDRILNANLNNKTRPNYKSTVMESQQEANQFVPQNFAKAPNLMVPYTCQPRCREGSKTERVVLSLCKKLRPCTPLLFVLFQWVYFYYYYFLLLECDIL